jgi:hypothetical protein
MLPKISTPEFSTKIPSSGQKINFRPFLVKEEKILLMALEGGDDKEIERAIKKLLKECILDQIDVEKLATFDVEFLFLKLRAKSVGEVIELVVSHPEGDCTHKTAVKVNIDDIKVSDVVSDGKIQLTDGIGVKMRYPSLSDVTGMDGDNPADIFELIENCVEFVYDQTEVYSDFSKKELNEWIEGLNQEQFKKIAEFFSKQPRLEHKIKWTCKECGKEDEIVIRGLQNFFA